MKGKFLIKKIKRNDRLGIVIFSISLGIITVLTVGVVCNASNNSRNIIDIAAIIFIWIIIGIGIEIGEALNRCRHLM